jgi:hypothetical protein
MKTMTQLTGQIAILAKAPEDNFLELAKALRELRDLCTDQQHGSGSGSVLFENTIKKSGIGRRKAYYMIELNRAFGHLKIPQKRLLRLGWTKLMLLSRHVTSDNWQDVLDFADGSTVDELRADLEGKEQTTHYIALRFTDEEYQVFASALLTSGAYLVGNAGLANKEQALMRVFRVLAVARKAGIW